MLPGKAMACAEHNWNGAGCGDLQFFLRQLMALRVYRFLVVIAKGLIDLLFELEA